MRKSPHICNTVRLLKTQITITKLKPYIIVPVHEWILSLHEIGHTSIQKRLCGIKQHKKPWITRCFREPTDLCTNKLRSCNDRYVYHNYAMVWIIRVVTARISNVSLLRHCVWRRCILASFWNVSIEFHVNIFHKHLNKIQGSNISRVIKIYVNILVITETETRKQHSPLCQTYRPNAHK